MNAAIFENHKLIFVYQLSTSKLNYSLATEHVHWYNKYEFPLGTIYILFIPVHISFH